ncbi:MAG: hypothetical protein NTY77_17945 [Elusimicrobia bacterium]|nr:hypothetical protein [Elusimicrobiota bacterium]
MKRWLLPAALLLCLPACLKPVTDPDLPWHLASARWMLEHRAVPRADVFSWTRGGRPWVDFEWCAQLALHGLDRLGGEPAVWLFKSLAFFALLLCLALLLRRWAVPDAWLAAALPPAALTFVPYFNYRPEIFSLFLCLGQLALLEELRAGERPWPAAPVLALQAAGYALWANLHGAFPLGIVLCLLYATEGGRSGRLALAQAAAAAAGTLANPYGPKLYTVFLQHAKDWMLLRNYIVEWADIELFDLPNLPHLGIILFSFLAALAAVWQRVLLPRAHLGVLVVSGLFCSGAFRHSVYIPLLLLPLALKTCLRLEAGLWGRRARWSLAAGILLFTVHADAKLVKLLPLLRAPRGENDSVPAGAVRFLKGERKTLAKLKFFNSWNCGGYLDYNLYPDYQVFLDGRYLFTDMLPELENADNDPAAWRRYADRFGLEVVLFSLDRPRYRLDSAKAGPWRPFDVLAMPAKDWALVYWDDISLVFVRRRAVPSAWLAAREFRYLRPGDLQIVGLKTVSGMIPLDAVAAEAARYRKEIGAPAETARINAWLAVLKKETGRAAPAGPGPRPDRPGRPGSRD